MDLPLASLRCFAFMGPAAHFWLQCVFGFDLPPRQLGVMTKPTANCSIEHTYTHNIHTIRAHTYALLVCKARWGLFSLLYFSLGCFGNLEIMHTN